MASQNTRGKIEGAKRDLDNVVNSQNFLPIKNMSGMLEPFLVSKSLASKYFGRVDPLLSVLDDDTLGPLIAFAERLAAIGDGKGRMQNESINAAIMRVTDEFRSSIPSLIYGLLEAWGIVGLSESNFPTKWKDALNDITNKRDEASAEIRSVIVTGSDELRKTAKEAADDLERTRSRANKIAVDAAQQQFMGAAVILRWKAGVWSTMAVVFFGVLVWCLLHFSWYPPMLIQEIVDGLKPGSPKSILPVSVPLLIAATAYFTSVRLALIGVLGVGLAYSLRMTGAYFQLLEHNWHKLRVTNSIEAFVAAVRTDEHKDLVLSKLVESVTDFGESGILGGQNESGKTFPSVLFEAVTKNVGKAE